MRPVGNHVHAAILRAVAAQAGLDPVDREKPIMVVEEVRSTDWASATFVGARHEFALRLCGSAGAVADAVARLVAGLAECDIPISGQIVADIGLTLGNEDKRNVNMVEVSLSVNALTIVD
jgi:regulator of RNase E activity RraA